MKTDWIFLSSGKRKFRIGGGILLLLVLAAEFFVKLHPYFEIAEVLFFHAIFAFISCLALIVIAAVSGLIIKRRDDYYDE